MQVGARIVARGRAVAFRVERGRIVGVPGVAQVDGPAPRVGETVAPVARRQDAVEHVDAAPDRLDEVLRRADAHEITRLLRRQDRHDTVERRQHQLLALADREAADRVARKIHADERFRRAPPQLGVRAALHDRKQRLAGLRLVRESGMRALRPAQRQLHRLLRPVPLGRQLDALVELHLDVGAEQALDLDGALGR